jgi:transaldolase
MKAAEILTKENIHCNMTLLFSLPQAVAGADVGVQLVSPFVGRILDWYKEHNENKEIAPEEEPGVKLVKDIFNYYKKFDYRTEIMGASFRNIGEITELAGCDLLTISPKLLNELEQKQGTLERKLDIKNVKKSSIERMNLDEKKFRWLMNEDAMATDKLAEGIRKFARDMEKLEDMLMKKL